MNKKISQFNITHEFNDGDVLTLVQNSENKIITKESFNTNLSDTFATNERVDIVEGNLNTLEGQVTSNYEDLSVKIVEGDKTVTANVTSTVNSYYDVLNNKIITLDIKHDVDIDRVDNSVQAWIDDIANRSTLQQLLDTNNRLAVTEALVTALAELIASGSGGGVAPGFHTQPTSTIFPLSGYYKGGDGSALNTTDTLNQALSKLEVQIDNVSSSSGSLPVASIANNLPATDGNIFTAARSNKEHVSKLYDDTVSGYLTFLKGTQWGKQFGPEKDFLGVGAAMYKDNSNKWNLDVDNLFVRGQMTVNELLINEIKAVGGEILVTVADMKCASVVEYDTYYRCYMPEDTTNMFTALDQAICQKFDGKNVKRYWRLVIDTGSDETGNYIDLSKYDCEAGSAAPEIDDNIIQLGNRNNADRQSAIKISAKGATGPSIRMYNYITGYSLEGKEGTVIGRDSKFVGSLVAVSPDGTQVPIPVDKGIYVAGNTYYYYDRVSYMGSLWLCMAQPSTTEAPNKDKPYVWQLQVEKGDAGQSGTDVAKWVEIIGDRLFMYDNPEFTGVPNPVQIVLDCNHYGIENPTYSWVLKGEVNEVIGDGKQCTVEYNMLKTRNATIRCTVTEGAEEFYDEVQLSKLGNGAQGEDAYYIDLSNGNMTVPFAADGITPLIDLDQIYTQVRAYKGTKEVLVTEVSAELIEGVAAVKITKQEPVTITLTDLRSRSARFKLTVIVEDKLFTKDLWVNQSTSGEDGMDGVDPSYVMVTGEQIFHYSSDKTTVTPQVITLNALAYNLHDPRYVWYWSVTGSQMWQLLENENASTLTVSPNGTYFTGVNEVSFKCEVTSVSTYYDIITVSKVYDGVDGEGAYIATLTNENQSIPANYSGGTLSTDIAKVSTEVDLLYGSESVKDYKVRRIIQDPSNTSEITPTSLQITNGEGSKKFTLSKMDNTKDKADFRLEFVIDVAGQEKVVASKNFSIVKQKGGKPGDFVVQLYGYRSSTPSNRPSMGKIGVPTSAGVYDSSNSITWYLDIPSGVPIWMTKSTYTANDDGTVTSSITDGYYWTKPVQVSGKDGANGATGPQGPQGDTGRPGYDGQDGAVGQVQTFRGDYSSSKTYYLDTYRCDVVYYATTGRYYRRIGSYTGTSVTPTNTSYWRDYTANFDSVATDLLLAKEADIAGWKFNDNYIYSQNGSIRLDGRSDGTAPIKIAVGTSAHTNPSTASFRVRYDGLVTATNADISGVISANSGKIGPWTIDSDRLKYVGSDWSTISKIYAGTANTFTTDQNGVKAFALGTRIGGYIPNSKYQSTNIFAAINDATSESSYGGKKTTMFLRSAGGDKNTALVINGNVAITGSVGIRYIHTKNTMPNDTTGFDHNHCFLNGSNQTMILPSTTQLKDWFGDDPNSYKGYYDAGGTVEGDFNIYGYDLYVTSARYSSGTLYICGNYNGGDGVSSGTQLYGPGVDRGYTNGRIGLSPGQSKRFTMNRGNWYVD